MRVFHRRRNSGQRSGSQQHCEIHCELKYNDPVVDNYQL